MYRHLFLILLSVNLLCACHSPRPAPPALFLIEENGLAGFINEHGEKVIAPRFAASTGYSEGLIAVRENGRYGYIDLTGRYVIPPRFDFALPFSEGLAIVNEDNHYYYIDVTGKKVFAAPYKTIFSFSGGMADIETYTGNEGYVDRSGRLVIDTLYSWIRPFSNGRAVANKADTGYGDHLGVIDSAGRIIVPFDRYDRINPFYNGYAIVSIPGKNDDDEGRDGVIDVNGRLIFERPRKNNSAIYGEVFSNGLTPISMYKYWEPDKKGVSYTSEKSYAGYINLRNEIVLNDTLIESAKEFRYGRAFVKRRDSGYYMINTAMHRVSTAYYRDIKNDTFTNGHGIVYSGTGWGIVDTNARWIAQPNYDDIDEAAVADSCFFYANYIAGKGKLYGIARFDGRIILPPVMQAYTRGGFTNGLLQAVVNKQLCYINKAGKTVWQHPDTPSLLRKMNIDYMLRAHYLAYSTPEKLGERPRGGGWYISGNIPHAASGRGFKDGMLSLFVDMQKTDTFEAHFIGHPLYLANMTKETILFNAQDSRLYMKLQARVNGGEWKDIEYIPGSWCGNSYHRLALEPAHYWAFVMPDLDGEIPAKLRLELKYIDKDNPKNDKVLYSNEINARVNPAQFWRKEEYTPGGIMDPYFE